MSGKSRQVAGSSSGWWGQSTYSHVHQPRWDLSDAHSDPSGARARVASPKLSSCANQLDQKLQRRVLPQLIIKTQSKQWWAYSKYIERSEQFRIDWERQGQQRWSHAGRSKQLLGRLAFCKGSSNQNSKLIKYWERQKWVLKFNRRVKQSFRQKISSINQ